HMEHAAASCPRRRLLSPKTIFVYDSMDNWSEPMTEPPCEMVAPGVTLGVVFPEIQMATLL
ncbi:hypothetical protein Tco_1479553, partial [Tanacetum coccineum]